MSFGDFAMGYLVGQSFAGPNMPGDGKTPYEHWSNGAKKEFQKMLDDIGDRAYWEAWDKAYREGVIEDLKNGKSILVWNKKDIYLHIDGIKQAELIERGELKIIALRAPINIITAMWANEEREEAKAPNYIALQASNKEDMKCCDYRII